MNKRLLRRTVLAAAISTASSGSMAAGFYLQETSASGLGRAFAAENTIGDNAAILARNPAGSALFDSYTISGGVTYVNPEIDAEGDVTYITPLGNTTFSSSDDDYATSAWVPNAYLAAPINDSWSYGLAMYTDYGLETDFSNNFLVSSIANKTELLTVNVAPSIAYDFNDQFSIGLAANFLYADATLKTTIPNDFPLDSALGTDLAGSTILNLEGDDWDVSWTLGALWNISERTRFGISYHAELDPELEGDVNSDLLPSAVVPTLPPFDDAKGKLTLDLPDTLELGFHHRFNENWGLALGAMWTDWDDFERLEANIPSARLGVNPEPFNPLHIKEENFESGWRYSIGGEYYPCEEVTWRIGYAYDEGAARDGLNPTDETANALGLPITWRTLSIPDTDRQWITFGGTYEFNNQLSVDGGFAYLWGDDETIQEFTDIPVPTYFDGGTTNIEAWLASVSLNYEF
ncbi:outer membrane protein transport protein [Microbulbifer halophilus]|uniref:Outer membrane protein transport protein n=1 Tax=Microbulbifer halophilus TaxID=453963 RepID=A0ABW5E7U4_9GAMM|nr:outer membrane protein transport protein [Microbulbifer halophilus]MCW8125211.1 outer membrane protein transport protein [Microbulbifer halophilus]